MQAMNKMKINQTHISLILLTFLALTGAVLQAQIKVTRITSQEQLGGKSGIVYSLPHTVIVADLNVSKVQQFAGPLAAYAGDILGINEVITKDGVSFSLESAEIRTVTEPDPDEVYLIEKEEKSQGEVWISFGKDMPLMNLEVFDKTMTPDGFSSWNKDLYMTSEPAKLFRKYTDSPTREITDTIIRKVSIDTLVIEEQILRHSREEYSDLEKAQDAADKIRQIEHDKYNLLIGYPETAYSKDALEYMVNELEKQRLEYLKLFTGVTVRENLKFSIPVIPKAGDESMDYVLTGFSKTTGLIEAEDQNGIILSIITPENYKPSDAEISGSGLVYQVPESFQAKVVFQGKELTARRIEVLQLGKKLSLPSSFKRIEYNLEKGTLETVVME
jgi:hypothetical protein